MVLLLFVVLPGTVDFDAMALMKIKIGKYISSVTCNLVNLCDTFT